MLRYDQGNRPAVLWLQLGALLVVIVPGPAGRPAADRPVPTTWLSPTQPPRCGLRSAASARGGADDPAAQALAPAADRCVNRIRRGVVGDLHMVRGTVAAGQVGAADPWWCAVRGRGAAARRARRGRADRARHVGHPAARRAQEQAFVPVARASAVCPDAVADATTATHGRAGRARSDRRSDSCAGARLGEAAGSASMRPLGADGPITARLTDLASTDYDVARSSRSPQDASDTGADGEPLVATASGALAPGFTASMTTRSTSDDIRGLASTACVAPGNDFWFVGSGAVVGRRGRLYLSNPESVPAVVDVALYGPAGPDRRTERSRRDAGSRCAAGAQARRVGAGHRALRRPRAGAPGSGRRGVARPAGSRAHPDGRRLGARIARARPAGWCCPACRRVPGSGACRSSCRVTRTPSCGSG